MPVVLALLWGCGDPISNRVLEEDAAFQAALPTSTRLYAPRDLLDAMVVDAEVLDRARSAAWEVQELFATVVASGDELERSDPSLRNRNRREWTSAQVATAYAGTTRSFFVRGSVWRLSDDRYQWTIEVAADPGGPWRTAGAGAHDEERGSLTWHLDAVHESFQIEGGLGDLIVAYDTSFGVTTATLTMPTLERTWFVDGGGAVRFDGPFALTGEELPGMAEVVVIPGMGGRGEGTLEGPGLVIPFSACWDHEGRSTWLLVDSEAHMGEQAACVLERSF
jgi:hypothetical protein